MNPPAANDASAREKILVRGVNWLGDAVMSVPALQRLRETKPGARITCSRRKSSPASGRTALSR